MTLTTSTLVMSDTEGPPVDTGWWHAWPRAAVKVKPRPLADLAAAFARSIFGNGPECFDYRLARWLEWHGIVLSERDGERLADVVFRLLEDTWHGRRINTRRLP